MPLSRDFATVAYFPSAHFYAHFAPPHSRQTQTTHTLRSGLMCFGPTFIYNRSKFIAAIANCRLHNHSSISHSQNTLALHRRRSRQTCHANLLCFTLTFIFLASHFSLPSWIAFFAIIHLCIGLTYNSHPVNTTIVPNRPLICQTHPFHLCPTFPVIAIECRLHRHISLPPSLTLMLHRTGSRQTYNTNIFSFWFAPSVGQTLLSCLSIDFFQFSLIPYRTQKKHRIRGEIEKFC